MHQSEAGEQCFTIETMCCMVSFLPPAPLAADAGSRPRAFALATTPGLRSYSLYMLVLPDARSLLCERVELRLTAHQRRSCMVVFQFCNQWCRNGTRGRRVMGMCSR